VFVVCLAWVGQANAGPRDFNQLLRGEYAFTGEGVCLTSPGGFTANFSPIGPSFVNSFSVQGIRTFNGDGTGTVSGRTVSVGHQGPANARDFAADFTYTVAPDRSFTVDQGLVTSTLVAGPGTVHSVATDVKFSGRISQDLKTLVLSTKEPNVETVSFTPPGGQPVVHRICHRARVAIKIK
jgi:hypothetical protein